MLFYNFIEFIMLVHTFLAISFVRYKEYVICLISFSTFFVQVLLAIFEAFVNILIPLPFCCLLKSRIFLTISTILFGFSFSGISFLIMAFFKLSPSETDKKTL